MEGGLDSGRGTAARRGLALPLGFSGLDVLDILSRHLETGNVDLSQSTCLKVLIAKQRIHPQIAGIPYGVLRMVISIITQGYTTSKYQAALSG